jgi:hypothetical protein
MKSKRDEIGGACGAYGGEQKWRWGFGEEIRRGFFYYTNKCTRAVHINGQFNPTRFG